ncbi:MAG: GTP-binding protein [Burkholderiales bacterium]|nr:GTP-binding protein [Burkholderiales bacterium]
MESGRDALAGRIPVTLLTGFLGAGKTTLLAKLVRHPDMNRVAVVINEVGEIGIDHDLVAMSSENVALLANGCLCCSVRTDLQDTLRELFGQRRAGAIPDFDRVVIETTGLADPAPVVQTLAGDTMLAAHYRLDGVVTLVDAVNGPGQLQRQPEAVKQVALADRVFVTKSDIAPADQVQQLQAAIAALNPGVRVSLLVKGEIAPGELTNLGLASARAGAQTLSFLGEPLAGEGGQGERTLRRTPAHDSAIRTLSLRFEQPFTWTAFSAAIELLASLRGPDLLRVKGIVNVEGRPVVVQGVQHVFHEPVALDRWPSADTGTRLVFITRNIEAATIRNLLQAVAAAAGGGSA